MLNKLYTKLALVTLALFLILGVVLVEVNRQSSELYALETTQRVNRDIALHAAEDMPLWVNGKPNAPALKELAHHVMLINPIVEVYLIAADGTVLSHALPHGSVEMTSIDLQPLREFLDATNPLPIFGDDPRDPTSKKVFAVSTIASQGEIQAYLYTVLNGQAYQSARNTVVDSEQLRSGQLTIAISLMLAVAVGLLCFFGLTRRLRGLMNTVRDYRQGQFRGRIPSPAKKSRDEIGELHQLLGEMSERIEQQFDEIETVDRTRRELIANVSHDLRTPVSALQGYLETAVFKMDSLSDDELSDYINIAHKHSRRLNERIGELFELAKLESPGIQPNWEVFPLGELIHDLVQDQQLQARELNISLAVHPNNENLFARADIALVHRVLENLVSNALKNTHAGGHITVGSFAHEDGICVQVVDDGDGISEAALPHIFERFYSEEVKPKASSNGLGLAIVKRIMELHQSRVTVKSEPNQETVFSFWLPFVEA